jgi:hypothetical protein
VSHDLKCQKRLGKNSSLRRKIQENCKSMHPPQGFQYVQFSPFSTRPLQGTECLLRAHKSSVILSAASNDRLASVVNENYVTAKRTVYKGFCIRCHNSNSRFNDGSPRATPPTTAQSSNTHAAQYTLPITEICGPNEWREC